jgi:hypothetical protein
VNRYFEIELRSDLSESRIASINDGRTAGCALEVVAKRSIDEIRLLEPSTPAFEIRRFRQLLQSFNQERSSELTDVVTFLFASVPDHIGPFGCLHERQCTRIVVLRVAGLEPFSLYIAEFCSPIVAEELEHGPHPLAGFLPPQTVDAHQASIAFNDATALRINQHIDSADDVRLFPV